MQDEGDLYNIQVVVMIAEHLSMRPLILQCRLISAGDCVYIYIYLYTYTQSIHTCAVGETDGL